MSVTKAARLLGVEEDGLFAIVEEVGEGARKGAGRKFAHWLRQAVEGTDDLPLADLLKPFGIECRVEAMSKGPVLGVKLAGGGGDVKLVSVFDEGPAQAAGLSAGDVILAVDGLKVTAASFDAHLARRKPGDRIEIHAFRRDELMRFDVELAAAPEDTVKLAVSTKPSAAARALQKGWLGA